MRVRGCVCGEIGDCDCERNDGFDECVGWDDSAMMRLDLSDLNDEKTFSIIICTFKRDAVISL